MKIVLLLLSFIALSSETCDKKKENKTTEENIAAPPEEAAALPKCIQTMIDSIKKQPRYNPPAEVTEYNYNGKRVFLFTSDCCDNFNTLFDDNCKKVCTPTGGITGKGDFSCTDFTEKAKLVKVVWRDERK